jgi:hypothetical protein
MAVSFDLSSWKAELLTLLLGTAETIPIPVNGWRPGCDL